MAANPAQREVIDLLKTLRDFFVIMCHNVLNVWPKTTLLPVWRRDTQRLDTLQFGGTRSLAGVSDNGTPRSQMIPKYCYSGL